MAPVVAAYQAMRGVSFIVAVTVVAEIGDVRRFDNPCQVMAFLGLVPSERSTGETVRRAGLTLAGNRLTTAGCTHQPIRTGSGRRAVLTPAFKWVNTALGNIKTAIAGTCRAIRDKHVPRYLAEFEYRFNRRKTRHAAFRSVLGIVVARNPTTYKMLIAPEATA
jgi:hypothetical protein